MLSPGTPAGPAANGNGSRDVEPSGRPEAETPAALLPLRRAVLPLAAAALLSACSGGGGAGRGMDGPAAGSVNGTGAGSRCVETRSFGCLSTKKWGLSRIRTEPAWSRLESRYGGGTVPGAGQTVGVIYTGIDREHPAFCGGSAACTKTVAETFLDNAPDETGTTTSHGTAVAGVIAGRLQDAPGVAWGADVAMFAIPLGTASGGYSPVSPFALQANDSRYAGYFNEALAWSSGTRTLDFVNLSFAFSGAVDMYSISVLRAALDDTIAALAQDGAADKTVFVWGAGNAHGRRCDPAEFTSNPDLCEPHVENGQTRHRVNARSVEVTAGLPARIPELHGHVIAVVAIGPDGRIADFSNRCGIAARWCLAAPGVDIRTAYFGPHPDTNEAGTRGVFSPDGTSVAAPLATGALVVMKHWFRDTMSNTELVTRLLDTANDSGIYADSTVYGHGLLDLDAATTPVGTSTLALGDEVGGPGSPVTRTGFDPGHAFGNGPALALAGREIVAFDSLGAPFWYDLGSFARAAPRATVSARLGAFMAPEAWAPRGALRPDPAGSGLVRAAGTALTAAAASPPLLGGFAPMDRGAGRNAGREGPRPGFVDAPSPGLGGGHLSPAPRAPALDPAG
ncbi:MAG: S8 family serine peptidase, partial [Rhodospirillaceae bacterium]|nr:S8 family serine peptidase [Rhodospirillaceae bacterium]